MSVAAEHVHQHGQEPSFTDPSCYHATLATLLKEHTPEADPAFVLGGTAGTDAELADGWVTVHDSLPTLCETLRGFGYDVVSQPLDGNLDALLEDMRDGRPVVAIADTFHLAYYWIDHGRAHAPHAVVLRAYNPADDTVRLTDPVDIVYFDDRVDVGTLIPALSDTHVELSWLTVRPTRSAGVPVASWPGRFQSYAGSLTGAGGDRLSGVELTQWLAGAIDDVLSTLDRMRRPKRAPGADPERDRVAGLLLGMWSYHHTLRWLERHLALVPSLAAAGQLDDATRLEFDVAADSIERASQDWLVARGLLTRSVVLSAVDRGRYRDEILHRLAEVTSAHLAASDALRRLAGRSGW